jgi:hypothetical protein
MLLKHSLTRTIIQPLFAEVRFISFQGLFTGVKLIFSLFDFLSVLTLTLFQISAYTKALDDAISVLDKIAMSVDVNDRKFTWILLFLPMFKKVVLGSRLGATKR